MSSRARGWVHGHMRTHRPPLPNHTCSLQKMSFACRHRFCKRPAKRVFLHIACFTDIHHRFTDGHRIAVRGFMSQFRRRSFGCVPAKHVVSPPRRMRCWAVVPGDCHRSCGPAPAHRLVVVAAGPGCVLSVLVPCREEMHRHVGPAIVHQIRSHPYATDMAFFET